MRTWIAIGIILALALTLVNMFSSGHVYDATPPGQYPLDKRRPQWTSVQSVGRYRPMADDNSVPWAVDAKVRCSRAKACA